MAEERSLRLIYLQAKIMLYGIFTKKFHIIANHWGSECLRLSIRPTRVKYRSVGLLQITVCSLPFPLVFGNTLFTVREHRILSIFYRHV